MAILSFEHARAGMNENRHVELADFLVKRPQDLGVEITVFVSAHELHASKTEIFHRAPKLADRFVDVGKINPGDADEAFSSGDVLGNGVVVGARHLDAEVVIDFVDQRPVVGNDDLVIETFPFHDVVVHIEIPAGLAERMNFFAVAVVSRGVAGKGFAVTNHRARAFLKFQVTPAGMLHAVEKTHRPVMSVAVDVHENPRGERMKTIL